MPNDSEVVELPPDAATANDNQNPRRRRANAIEPTVGVLVTPEPERHTFDRMVLHDSVKMDIAGALRALRTREAMEAVWSISMVQPQAGRCILNFYGPPGTGKTLAALAIANQLGKPLYQVDYAAIISKYLGDTAKHLVTAFREATELGAVLFFDEADSLMSRRVAAGESCSTSINQNRNVLMQELDRFDGIVIVTTNLFGNYDPALLRRIQRHVKFELPNRAMRKRLFELHLPNLNRVAADLDAVAGESKGLAGGDVLNVCVNAMYAASSDEDPANWRLTQAMLLEQVSRVRKAKREHESDGSKPKAKRPTEHHVLGFGEAAQS